MIFNRSFKLSHARAAEALANQPSNSGSVRGPLISKLEVNFLSGTHPPDRDRQASFVQNGAACVVGQMFIMRARRSYWSKAARHGMEGTADADRSLLDPRPACTRRSLSGKDEMREHFFMMCLSQLLLIPSAPGVRAAPARPPCWVGLGVAPCQRGGQ